MKQQKAATNENVLCSVNTFPISSFRLRIPRDSFFDLPPLSITNNERSYSSLFLLFPHSGFAQPHCPLNPFPIMNTPHFIVTLPCPHLVFFSLSTLSLDNEYPFVLPHLGLVWLLFAWPGQPLRHQPQRDVAPP